MSENISLRNYFAASALQGMIAEPSLKATPNEFAIKAYELADAMIRCGYHEVDEPKKYSKPEGFKGRGEGNGNWKKYKCPSYFLIKKPMSFGRVNLAVSKNLTKK